MSHRYTFGLEEEFFLTDLTTRNIAGNPPAALFAACRKAFGESASHELLRSQIELISPVLHDGAQARAWLAHARGSAGRIAQAHGLGLLAAGTHPLARWREQQATDKPRYERLLDDFQIVAQRNLLCGLHVHVAVPDTHDRIQVMNQIVPWLPFLLALSASSPFWERRRTGLMSYRQAVYDEWPRTGIPEFFENERTYRAFVDVLVESGALRNESYLWWAIRPSMRYPTLELRIADACPLALDAHCIAALFRAMVKSACEQPELGAARNEMTRLLVEENRWRAKRFGTGATFMHQKSRRSLSIVEWLAMARERFGDAAAALDDDWAFDRAAQLLAEGGSADRQLRRHAEARAAGQPRGAALMRVVDALLDETLRSPSSQEANT